MLRNGNIYLVTQTYLVSLVTYYYTTVLWFLCVVLVGILLVLMPVCMVENPANRVQETAQGIPKLLIHFLQFLKYQLKTMYVANEFIKYTMIETNSYSLIRKTPFLTHCFLDQQTYCLVLNKNPVNPICIQKKYY